MSAGALTEVPSKGVVQAELERMFADNGGTLQPRQVLEAAKDPTSPLHSCFPWDDREAAEQRRLDIAARLIRSVKVRFIEHTPQETRVVTVRRYHSLPEDRGPQGFYRRLVDINGDAQKREALVRMALGELAAFRRKYTALSELSGVFEAIDAALALAGQQESSSDQQAAGQAGE